MQGHNLEYRSLDIQNADRPEDATIWLDIWNPFEPAEVRGEDQVIPQKAGMVPMSRYKHRRIIELRGFVRGVGSDETERAESFRIASETLLAVMDYSLAPGTLAAFAPYLGLPTGSESSLPARAFDATPGPIIMQGYQLWVFRLLCVSTPPEWITEESS